MTKYAAACLTAVALTAALAGCSTTKHPVASAGLPATPASTTPAPAGPASFNLDWSQSNFASAACPAGHAEDICYSGTASGSLPLLGTVAMHRIVYTATATSTSKGCVTAVTDGTLTAPAGVVRFHARGTLCGALATYKLTSANGTGSLAGAKLTGTITNDGGTESWAGTVDLD